MKLKPGIYPIYKPKGPTSHDIIAQLRKITGIKRIGHAGTLDPLASGVLVVAIGREYTKQLSEYVGLDKEYIATIRLGETSETDDAEGVADIIDEIMNPKVEQQDIERILPEFIGEIEQVPPKYSALKIKGKPAYKRVRQGEKVEMKPRKVSIYDIEMLAYQWPMVKIRVHCGSGVYIRSLARDIGERLGIGAYLADLQRTRVGTYDIRKSIHLNKLGILGWLDSIYRYFFVR